MSVIFLLIPLSIVTAAVFLGGFIWAVRSGQYEDTCTPAMRLLSDDSDTTKTGVEKRAGETSVKTRVSGNSSETEGKQELKSE
jgi:cbb3-type cytochrome oxidase maturation protein